jgi:hypothetical protein
VPVALLTLAAAAAHAHVRDRRATLGELAAQADAIVRGTVTQASRGEHGWLRTTLQVDRALYGSMTGEIVFAADLDHGVRYAAGERVVVFLRRRRAGGSAWFSAQHEGEKYRITSFDLTGYDGLVTGLRAAAGAPDVRARTRAVLRAAQDSHEPQVRRYAAAALAAPMTWRGAPAAR